MLAAPARYVSVSELYSTDEVELLLDEIRELEPTSCRGEDLQDFEIAGSGCGGGRSPAGTEVTERSWDSHAQYLRAPPRPPQPLAPLYCRPGYLLTLQGAATLLVVLCSVCVCGLVWGGAGVRLGGTGGAAGALRALQLGALTSALLHAALLAMRLTALHLLMPLDWDTLSAVCCVWSGGWLAGGGGALLHALLTQTHARGPPPTRPVLDLFFAAIGVSAVASAACAVSVSVWARRRVAAAAAAAARGSYSAVPPAPVPEPAPAPEPAPSTSRHAPL